MHVIPLLPTPSPLPADWGNTNVYQAGSLAALNPDGSIMTVLGAPFVRLINEGTTPPSSESWVSFPADDGGTDGPNIVPQCYGSQPGVANGSLARLSVQVRQGRSSTTYTWSGTIVAHWIQTRDGSGLWVDTGLSYDPSGGQPKSQ